MNKHTFSHAWTCASKITIWNVWVCYLPSPATQWTATQHPGSSWNFFFSRLSQSSTSLFGGGAPSSNGQSWGRNDRHRQHLWQIDKCDLRVAVSHHHVDAVFLQRRFIVGDVTDANHCSGAVALQILQWKNSRVYEDAKIVAGRHQV